MISKLCKICNSIIYKKPTHSKKAWKKVKLCSIKCSNQFKKGKHISPRTEIKKGQHISVKTEFKKKEHVSIKTEFKKGMIPWTKGKKIPIEVREKIRAKLKGKKIWPTRFYGTNSEYVLLHQWVIKKLGKPPICSNCKKEYKTKNMHWANKSQEYKKDLSDWMRLCVKCHYAYDRKGGIWENLNGGGAT